MANSSKSSITLSHVARAAGVSKATAGFACAGNGLIAQSTRERVLEVARELGYEANPHAKRLAEGRSLNEITLFSLNLDLGVGTRKLQKLQSLLSQRGYKVPIQGFGALIGQAAQTQVAEFLGDLRRHKPRAIVCYTSQLGPPAIQELCRYQDEGGILVCYDFPVEIECDRVIFDREDSTYQAARHLIENGHSRLGLFMLGPQAVGGVRLEGFKRALGENGLEVRNEWLFASGDHWQPETGGVEMARYFLELKPENRPSGVCLLNDAAALSFLATLARSGVAVPTQISVVGHDDTPASALSGVVPLSTVSHPSEAIVAGVIELLSGRLSGQYDGAPREIRVRGEMRARHSVSPL